MGGVRSQGCGLGIGVRGLVMAPLPVISGVRGERIVWTLSQAWRFRGLGQQVKMDARRLASPKMATAAL